jgi:hypothetical protein
LKQNSLAAVIQKQVAGLYPVCEFEAGAMCEKCIEVDEKIERYERLSTRINDQPTLDGIKELVERLKAEKHAR